MGMGIMKGPPQMALGRLQHATINGTNGSTIPTLPDGSRPRYVLVTTNINMLIAFGSSTIDASTSGSGQGAWGTPMVYNVAGCTHFSVNAGAVSTVWIVPLANQ